MKSVFASVTLAAALAASAVPALAAQFIQDNAGLFSAGTVAQLDSRITNFNRQTGKEIAVVTVPSAPNADARTAAENTFAQQSVNGVLIYIDKGDRQTEVLPDRAAVQAGWWSSSTSQSVVSAINSQFKAGNYDAGITNGVNAVFDVYRSHLNSQRSNAPATTRNYAQQTQSGGVHIGVFWWIIIALFVFFIIRSLIRARQGMYYGGGYGGPGYGPGGGYGPGYGPGYGGWGYGGGGWGGGFWSGLLGGLGGAWLGNELFDRQNYGGTQAGVDPSMQQPPADAGGWQSDPGQADMGGGAGGGWGGGDFGGGGFGGGGFGGGDGGAGGGW